MITADANCTREIKSRIALKKQHSTRGRLFYHLRNELVNCYTWNIALQDAATWTLRNLDHKYLADFYMWCHRSWRRSAVQIMWKMKYYIE